MSTVSRLAAVCLAAAVAVAVGGCESDMVGSAAVVGDDRLSVGELQDQVEEVEALDGFDVEAVGGTAQLQRSLLTRHIQHQIVQQLAEQEDVEVSEADVDNRIDEVRADVPEGDLEPLLASEGFTDESFRTVVVNELIAQSYLEATGSAEEELTEELRAISDSLDVRINPRYGSWGDSLQVVDDSGSISTPAP